MALIYDTITAENVSGYWKASQENVDTTLGDKLFPARKQLGIKLAFVKGGSGKAVALKPAAFDTKAPLRERMNLSVTEEQMPFFKEAIVVKEEERQQLNMIEATGNQALIDSVVTGIFDDQTHLVSGALARLEAMRMQVLATGKISFNNNGVAQEFDYGVKDSMKGTVEKAWTDAAATPLADIEKAMENQGKKAEILIMTQKTFSLIKKADSTIKIVKPLAPKGAAVTNTELTDYLLDAHGVKVEIKNDTFTDDDGVAKKFYPEGYVSFIPNDTLGKTVFGTTPEESDLLGGNVAGVEVAIVNTGIAITTQKLVDPVNVQTKASMIALPSFERLDDVYMLDIEP
ncbi:MAG: major capsid protein E [Streptococcus sp.]|nr:MAG: major capsid protein E [Streptococcus sp.]